MTQKMTHSTGAPRSPHRPGAAPGFGANEGGAAASAGGGPGAAGRSGGAAEAHGVGVAETEVSPRALCGDIMFFFANVVSC